MIKTSPFSVVFQVVQECPFKCPICNRRSEPSERHVSSREREIIVDVLKASGAKRITITGGEPLLLGSKIDQLLQYIHGREIHTCLSTTGIGLDEQRIDEMDRYLDHLLIPVRSLQQDEMAFEFGNKKSIHQLFSSTLHLLSYLRHTGIILEVSTVLHKKNANYLVELGYKLLDINPNIVWRIEDYYAMGIGYDSRKLFELRDDRQYQIKSELIDLFDGKFRNLYIGKNDRLTAPDLFITPQGDLVTTSNNKYGTPVANVLTTKTLQPFSMRRPWSDYVKYCRKWSDWREKPCE